MNQLVYSIFKLWYTNVLDFFAVAVIRNILLFELTAKHMKHTQWYLLSTTLVVELVPGAVDNTTGLFSREDTALVELFTILVLSRLINCCPWRLMSGLVAVSNTLNAPVTEKSKKPDMSLSAVLIEGLSLAALFSASAKMSSSDSDMVNP